ncbi:NAD-dependent protein deacetylase [Thermoproteus tenax]|uniref:NAD-dependent protein deacetylase n=1 Tax=Thermoproteus tenax (strain ATCC 35583 / DSM 2078 / JCM 9277 / NBRC 100435 / Kra 1) TaxID=768679 RepID=G4RPY9_THETK|nr:NAD-dependent protein deacetylase [Thermoproteus tenax]CCC81634.1 NAD-dependent deacetylase [Thermoproteus tenax Kra 1]
MDELREVADLLNRSNCAVALTGAGVSTPSGIPDFRGPQGLWRRIDPRRFEIAYFYAHPGEVWRLFVDTFLAQAEAKPNPAHLALAELEAKGKICAVITQNVDGLHQRAGSKRVIELHGSLRYAVCTSCGARFPLSEVLKGPIDDAPRCRVCGGVLKPDVVFFGEPLPYEALQDAMMLAELSDVFMAIGTSLAVAPANRLPLIAKRKGAKLVIINQDPTELDEFADIIIRGKVEEILPRIAELI